VQRAGERPSRYQTRVPCVLAVQALLDGVRGQDAGRYGHWHIASPQTVRKKFRRDPNRPATPSDNNSAFAQVRRHVPVRNGDDQHLPDHGGAVPLQRRPYLPSGRDREATLGGDQRDQPVRKSRVLRGKCVAGESSATVCDQRSQGRLRRSAPQCQRRQSTLGERAALPLVLLIGRVCTGQTGSEAPKSACGPQKVRKNPARVRGNHRVSPR